jgi:hypothetical protein
MIQYQVVYYSEATKVFTELELIELLQTANAYNTKNNITGCLIYANSKFIQILEGEQSLVRKLFEKIKNDKRHKNIIVAIEMSVSTKLFANWAMGFKYSERDLIRQYGLTDCAKWIYSEFNAEASPGKEAIFNFAVRNGLMKSQVLPF